MKIEEGMKRAFDAALQICNRSGNATAEEVAGMTGMEDAAALSALISLVKRGDLVVQPGGFFARPAGKLFRLPGESYPSDLKPSIAQLMRARA